ncbi:DUF4190 domain-containing protein [Streptomyces sp. NPDC006307]|uniref:DUF4190 domain-containing protein n=1 Tax=Streptomyces sp. NPDC006307 TaxID=3156748 RepID=UPI0033AC005A
MEPSSQGWPPPQQPHPAYGIPGYGIPGAPGPLPPPVPPINGLSIASLIVGILCCVPPLGMILGAIALARIKKKGERGKGLAIGGMVMSLVGTLLVTAGIASGGFREAYDGVREAMREERSSRSTFDLRKGQCFDRTAGGPESEAAEVEIVPCSRPHDGEITGSFKLTGFGKEWPGEKALDAQAEERCETISNAYAMDAWARPDNAWLYYYQPSKDSWRYGDREVSCSVAAETGKLTGSVRADSTTLDAHQLVYLQAMNPIDTVLMEEPEDSVEDDPEGNAAWARDVEATLTASAAALEKYQWPAVSKKAVTELVAQLKSARGHWRKAADTSDPDAFWEHYERGYDALPYDLGAEARTALGLADTPPDDPSEDPEDPDDPSEDPEDPEDPGQSGESGSGSGAGTAV